MEIKIKQKLTDQQKIDLVKDYETGNFTLYALSEKYIISRTSVSGLLKRRGIKIVAPKKRKSGGGRKRKYTLDEHYFDTIDTEDKAYFLGLLYADGCNYLKRNRIIIGLQECDKDILEKFNQYLKSNKPLYYKNRNVENPKWKNMYILCISSKKMCVELSKLGCVPQKSLILEFPTLEQVPEHLMRHFLRGCWDGDGCISIYTTQNKQKKASTHLTSSQLFCLKTKKYLKEHLNIHCSYILKGKNKLSAGCCINGNKQTLLFLNWLYNDATIYLDRKYKKYLEITQI